MVAMNLIVIVGFLALLGIVALVFGFLLNKRS